MDEGNWALIISTMMVQIPIKMMKQQHDDVARIAVKVCALSGLVDFFLHNNIVLM